MPTRDAYGEINALIETLRTTEQRLEELTGGEIDAVTDRLGRTFVLTRAQQHLRAVEAAKQEALLNALPAHVALLDARGSIVAVNEAWRLFAESNADDGPRDDVGTNYLEVCERAREAGSLEAGRFAEGLRAVLAGDAKNFSIEYPCHSPTQQRWFLAIVSALNDAPPTGVAVMHLDVTARVGAAQALRNSEQRFTDMMRGIGLAAVMLDCDAKITFCNDYLLRLTGWTEEEVLGRDWYQLFLRPGPGDAKPDFAVLLANAKDAWFRENEITTRPGTRRMMRWSNSVLRSSTGEVIGSASVGEDITEQRAASETLRVVQQRLALATDAARLGIWDLDIATKSVVCDATMYQLYGVAEDEVSTEYSRWVMCLHPDDRAAVEARLAAALAGEEDFHAEFRVVWPGGEVRHLEGRALVVRSADGAATRMIGVNWDISARKLAELRVKHLNRVYAVLSGINTLIVRARTRDELFREACNVAVKQGGLRIALLGMLDASRTKIWSVGLAGEDEQLVALIRQILADSRGAMTPMTEQAIREKRPIVSNDSQNDPNVSSGQRHRQFGVRSMAILPLVVADEAVGAMALYSNDIDFFQAEEMNLLSELAGDIAFAIDHIEKQDRLEYLNYYDALTGLANRSLFLERVNAKLLSARKESRHVAVFVGDIERFRNINEAFGRSAGDEMLKQVAERLVQHGRGDATRFARLGADRFAIVAPGIDTVEEIGRHLEQKMTAVFGRVFLVAGSELRVSIKMGVALFPEDGNDGDTLVRNAEAALKKARDTGERYLFFTEAMTSRVAESLSLELQLRRALENDEYVLHYQPKVNLANNKLTGVEALIRWNDPQRGLVAPGVFIPLLEETGLIREVGRWALRKAVEDYLRWRACGLDAVRIAVNVSPLQLRDRDFIAELRRTVNVDECASAALELEITEGVIMEDLGRSIAGLQAIREMGVQISIDDFGTGFSSLSYLAKLPVDTLKIDRSFIHDMTTGPQGLALVSTIINLAHSLKLKVVAEGVETTEQAHLLRLLSCDEMQGYLFSRPVPVEILENTFLAQTPSV